MATVLVVEDIANIRKFISLNLRASGYEVLEAAHAEEAIAQFGRSPSAIVLDLALPGIDGWQLLSEIVDDANVSNVPVVLTTATVLGEGERYRYRCIVDVLLKPFSAEQLVETVAQAVAKYPLPPDS
jgi:two-component system KDP operon response regulator KdpE